MSGNGQTTMKAHSSADSEVKPLENPKLRCGLVMPISKCDGLPESHWLNVKEILTDAVSNAGFEAELVSAADDVGIIQKRIIENLYHNPIVICDISGRNPNVMFELGLRLAFDKPTIIVKDDVTQYSFDTSPIEHLGYPRDLRYNQIVMFKQELALKVKATHEKATTDKNFTTFLKHFGTFTVAKLETKEVSADQLVTQELKELREMVSTVLSRSQEVNTRSVSEGSIGGPGHDHLVVRTIDYAKRTKVNLRSLKVGSHEYLKFLEVLYMALRKQSVYALSKSELEAALWDAIEIA